MDKKTYIIENRGKYRWIDWVVRFLDLGHRCGYVKIEDKAVFRKYEKEYAENNFILSLDVHGGITFIKKLEDGNGFGLPAGNWLGFDAAHHLDLNDYQCARKYFGNNERYDQCEQINFRYKIEGASIKTEDYMIAECKSLIDQILAKSVPSVPSDKSDKSVSILESLVPPSRLCKQIPEGKFENSALVWTFDDRLMPRTIMIDGVRHYYRGFPAPTLQEIMEKIEGSICVHAKTEWTAYRYITSHKNDPISPATAALKLWLELNPHKVK